MALELKKDQEAIDFFNEVVKRTDNALGAEARYLIAKIYFDRKEYPIAKKLCENINQDNSAYPYWIAQNLILYADVLVATKDIFNARAAIEAVLENFTDNQEITKMASDRLAEIEKIEIQNSRLLQVSKDSLQMDTLK